jgi:copper transport protein
MHATELLMRVEIDPAEAGPTDIQVETLTHGGLPLEVVELTGELSLPSRDIGPIPLALTPVEGKTGVFTAPDTDIPFAGTWRLDLSARLSEFDEASVAAEVPIK